MGKAAAPSEFPCLQRRAKDVHAKIFQSIDVFEKFLRHPPFFFRLASNALPDIGSVARKKKKYHKKSRNSRPWYPRTTLKVNIHIFGLTKYTI